jgi:hypothetical protein
MFELACCVETEHVHQFVKGVVCDDEDALIAFTHPTISARLDVHQGFGYEYLAMPAMAQQSTDLHECVAC